MQDEKIFAEGFIFKRQENAPDFVIGGVSIKVEEAINFLREMNKDGWVNLNVKQSKAGKYYMELDTWTPDPSKNTNTPF